MRLKHHLLYCTVTQGCAADRASSGSGTYLLQDGSGISAALPEATDSVSRNVSVRIDTKGLHRILQLKKFHSQATPVWSWLFFPPSLFRLQVGLVTGLRIILQDCSSGSCADPRSLFCLTVMRALALTEQWCFNVAQAL